MSGRSCWQQGRAGSLELQLLWQQQTAHGVWAGLSLLCLHQLNQRLSEPNWEPELRERPKSGTVDTSVLQPSTNPATFLPVHICSLAET